MNAISYGYRQAFDSGAVISGPWQVVVDGVPVGSPGYLPTWDYHADLDVVHEIDVDRDELLTASGLDEESTIGAALTWTCTGTGLRGTGDIVVVHGGPVELRLHLPGPDMGGTLTLRADLLLLDRGPRSLGTAPRRRYSRLWSEEYRLQLEGSGSRLPVMAVSFREHGIAFGKRALWYLDLDGSDLHAPVTGRITLYVNTDHPAAETLLEAEQASWDSDIVEFLLHDIARAMVNAALDSNSFDLAAKYDAGTVGAALQGMVQPIGLSMQELEALDGNILGSLVQVRTGFLGSRR